MFRYFALVIIFFLNSYAYAATTKQRLDTLERKLNDLEYRYNKEGLQNNSLNNSSDTEIEKVNENISILDQRIINLDKDIKNNHELIMQLFDTLDDLGLKFDNMNLDINTKLKVFKNDIININENQINDNLDVDNETSKKEDVSHKTPEKKNTLGELVISSNDLSDENEIKDSNENLKEKIALSPEEQFQNALDLIRTQKYENAIIAFLEFIKNNTENSLSGSAHYWLGEIYFLQKEYREAALILAEGYQKFPQSIKAADMLYKLSDALFKIDRQTDGCLTLAKFEQDFSNHKLLSKVRTKIDKDCNA